MTNFYRSFNEPGSCITKLFKDIKNDPFFAENFSPANTQSNLKNLPKEIFKGNIQENKIVSGCLMYHYKTHDSESVERLEIAIQGKEEAWVWMMLSKPKRKTPPTTRRKLWFREFILNKNASNKWNVTAGHEGELEDDDYLYQEKQMEIATGFDSYFENRWYDVQNSRPCSDSYQKCNNLPEKFLSLYWVPSEESQRKMIQLSNNPEDQIIRWNDKKQPKLSWSKKRVYSEGKWHTDISNQNHQELIKLKKQDLTETKGKWENLYGLCTNSSKENNEHYKIYCS